MSRNAQSPRSSTLWDTNALHAESAMPFPLGYRDELTLSTLPGAPTGAHFTPFTQHGVPLRVNAGSSAPALFMLDTGCYTI